MQRCELLAWAAEQDHLTPHLQGILVRLVRLMDERGAIALPQAKIAPAINLGVTQTRAAIKALVLAGVFERRRRAEVGKGRSSDVLTAALARAHDNAEVPAIPSNENADNIAHPANRENSQNDGNAEQSSFSARDNDDNAETPPVSKSKAPCISTRARAEPEPNNLDTSETLPETEEDVGEGGAGEEGAPRPLPVEMTERMRFDAAKMGFKNGSGDEQFRKWREWHSAKRKTVINFEQSFRNWLRKALEFKGRRQQHREAAKPNAGRKGFKLAGYGPDGQPRYVRDHRAGR